jgi:hypothetical protein
MVEFTTSPTEQTTAVTDLVLAAVALAGSAFLVAIRRADPWKARVWAIAFAALAAGAFGGAIVHGVELDSRTREYLWMQIHLALGFSVALFAVGAARDLWGEPAGRRLLPAPLGAAVVFFAITRLFHGAFFVFLIYEAAAMLAALAIYTHLALRKHFPGAGWMVAGIVLTLAASVAQASRVGPFTLVWEFDHNGVFHVVQTVALFALLAGLRAGLAGRPG